jgi:hypothetical protein
MQTAITIQAVLYRIEPRIEHRHGKHRLCSYSATHSIEAKRQEEKV